MELTDLLETIHYLKPTAEFVISNNDYKTIEWIVLEGDAPTWEEIEAAHLEVKAAEEAKAAEAAAKREAALAKLAALGLDTNDLKALGL